LAKPWAASWSLSGRLEALLSTTDGTEFLITGYAYDAFGQRVRKEPIARQTCSAPGVCNTLPIAAGQGTVYVFGNGGELLGEYNSATGAALREYVWLDGMPMAVVVNDSSNPAPSQTQTLFIHTDHLNTPRVVLNKSNVMRWSWMAEPFGSNGESNNPQGLGAFSFNLRMPGQYFDVESGLSYNYFRDYDAGIGRYAQSDPIGLQGGINTYSYVGGNPVSYIDPEGLQGVQAAPMLRPQPGIPGPAGQFPYIRPEWNYPGLPDAQQLTRICVRTSCPESQPPECTSGNPTGEPTQWKQGPFMSAPGKSSSACVCLEYGWGVRPNPMPVTIPSVNQNSGQPPNLLQWLIRFLR
jgi:RHS repeat-associated protein